MATKKKTKTIHVRMIRKPGEMGYLNELLNKTLNLPAAAVILYAKSKGVTLSTGKIYNFRWLARKKGKTQGASPKLLPAATKSTAIAKASSKSITKRARNSKRAARVKLSKPMGIEQQMLSLVVKIGTLRARALIDETENTICAGIGVPLQLA